MTTLGERSRRPTVLLPVGPGVGEQSLARAIGAIDAQSLAPAEILLVANGLGESEEQQVRRALNRRAGGGAPIRRVQLERASLAVALNVGLREARTPLVARMDADDWCDPRRLELQVGALVDRADLVGVACAWEVVDADGAVRAVMRPPIDPGRLRWRLHLGNLVAHGSMLLRREAVLQAGGYDESLARSQDYDLWLRLTRDRPALGAVGQVLYRYTERAPAGVAASSAEQAKAAGDRMLRAWGELPRAEGAYRDTLTRVIAGGMLSEHGAGTRAGLEEALDAEPTLEGLMAWLWASDRFPPLQRRAIDVCRRSRVREVGRRMRDAGAEEVWLWGAGQHTAWLLRHEDDLGLPVAGLVDDDPRAGERFGRRVLGAEALTRGQHALLSSDVHEEAMWERSGGARGRGVRVWRLYEECG